MVSPFRFGLSMLAVAVSRRFIFLALLFTNAAIISFEGGLFYAQFTNLQVSIDVTSTTILSKTTHQRTPARQTSTNTCTSTRGLCAALEEGLEGSLRCGESDVALTYGLPLPVRVYQLYEARENHESLYDCTNRLYQGLTIAPDVRRPDNLDIDSPAHLRILHNIGYQSNLCDFSGFFGLLASGELDKTPEHYVGFQNWKAQSIGFSLQCVAERTLVSGVQKALRDGEDVFFYWAAPDFDGVSFRFYDCCEKFHGKACTTVFQKGFNGLFGPNMTAGLPDGVPPMPGDTEDWAYLNHFAMPKKRFKEYLHFAALFFALLDDKYHDALIDPSACPLSRWDPAWASTKYAQRHCFCYVMERLVNIWAYHTGLRFLYIQPVTGEMSETHAVDNRTMLPWFVDGGLERSRHRILEELASRNDRGIYDQLLRPSLQASA